MSVKQKVEIKPGDRVRTLMNNQGVVIDSRVILNERVFTISCNHGVVFASRFGITHVTPKNSSETLVMIHSPSQSVAVSMATTFGLAAAQKYSMNRKG